MDWWAFGVLIYEMLAGYPPFYEEDTAQTYQRILHGRFTFPNDFPVTARDLVRKLLQVSSYVHNMANVLTLEHAYYCAWV